MSSLLFLVPHAISRAYLFFFVGLTLTAFQPPAYSQQRKAEPKFTPVMQKVIGQAKADRYGDALLKVLAMDDISSPEPPREMLAGDNPASTDEDRFYEAR